MSQFLLAQGVDTFALPGTAKVIPASSDEFLRDAAERIFGAEALAEVVTVLIGGDDIDELLVNAQRQVNEGTDYADTALSEFVTVLAKAAKRLALWYGDDTENLEPVNSIQALNEVVRDGLSTPSLEVYALFVKQ